MTKQKLKMLNHSMITLLNTNYDASDNAIKKYLFKSSLIIIRQISKPFMFFTFRSKYNISMLTDIKLHIFVFSNALISIVQSWVTKCFFLVVTE